MTISSLQRLLGLIAVTLLLGARSGFSFDLPSDPYAHIVEDTLPNGLHMIYAPTNKADTFRVKVYVRAGFSSETKKNVGISHVVEHYLFTDAKLEKDMTYLEVIQEKGGSANGQTRQMDTIYFANVPAAKASWLADVFYKMLFNRTFNDADLEHVKKPVLLEIGVPTKGDKFASLGLFDFLDPDFAKIPDFWKSEFGIEHKRFSRARERINVTHFKATQIEQYYKQYYHPGNISVFLSGNFNVPIMRKWVNSTFGTVPDLGGKELNEPTIQYRDRPFVDNTATLLKPTIRLGTKFLNASPEDELVLRVYTEYLAHRLMKDVRNKKGQTYSVSPDFFETENSGAATISMEGPPDDYQTTLNDVRSKIESETRGGKFSNDQFESAMNLYASHFTLKDEDSETLQRFGEHLARNVRIFGHRQTGFDAYNKMTYEDFQSRLSKLFNPKASYEQLAKPPLFFPGDFIFWTVLIGTLLIANARKLFRNDFDHTRVKWIRKFSTYPLYFMEISYAFLGLTLSGIVFRTWTIMQMKSNLINSSPFLKEFVLSPIGWSVFFFGHVLVCSTFYRKAVVSGDSLFLKSMSYFSKKLPLADIRSIEVKSASQVLFSLVTMKKWGGRFQYLSLNIWRPGLLIQMKDGRAYFFSIRNAEKVKSELSVFVTIIKTPLMIEDKAA